MSSEYDAKINASDLIALTSELKLSDEDNAQKQGTLHSDEPSRDETFLIESFDWLQNHRKETLDSKVLSSWMVVGERKVEFDENTKYAEGEVVKKLGEALKELDCINENQLRAFREKVNPLEMVKRGFLLNRSAVKFASIDSTMDYMFSNPKDKRNNSLIEPNELFYFVDIGGGPGGFVDYLLWRRDWQTKGFGFPMKGYDYHLKRFTTGAQRFNVFNGAHRDGDVTNEENIVSFTNYVKQHVTSGVHVVIADCAFNVDERKYAKETIFKRLHLGEIIMALSVLRPNGHLVIKLFDIFLPFTVGLIYLMHRCFAEVCLIKPKTCRPSNSERYLICKWKNSDTESVRMHFLQVNKTMQYLVNTNCDVNQLVAEDVLLGNTAFYDFILKSNNLIAELQLNACQKMIALINGSNDETVTESKDDSLIEKCLMRWNVIPKTNENVFNSSLGEWTTKFIDMPDNSLHPQIPFDESFNLPGDRLGNEWHFISVANLTNNKRTFYATTPSSSEVMMFDRSNSNWVEIPDMCLELPPNTFLYGEIVYHYGPQRDDKKPKPPYGFHIIDGVILNGQDIRGKPYLARLELCQKFADAYNNPSRYIKNRNQERMQSAAIYCKEASPLKNLVSYIENFRKSWKTIPNGSKVMGLNVRTSIGPKRFYEVKGLLFVRNYPKMINETNFTETFKCRQLWSWSRPYEVLNTVDMNQTSTNELVYLAHFCDYLNLNMRNFNFNSKQSSRRDAPSKYSSNRGKGNRGGKRGGFRR